MVEMSDVLISVSLLFKPVSDGGNAPTVSGGLRRVPGSHAVTLRVSALRGPPGAAAPLPLARVGEGFTGGRVRIEFILATLLA